MGASVSFKADAALRLSQSAKERAVVSLAADAALRLSVPAKVEVSLAGGQDVEPEVEDLHPGRGYLSMMA